MLFQPRQEALLVEVMLARHEYYLSFLLAHFVQVFVEVANSGQADAAFGFGVDESLDVYLLELLYG